MSYADTASRKADPRAIAAVLAIHAGAGLAIVAGLTVTGVIDPPKPPLTGRNIVVPLPPPPPEPAVDQPKPQVRSQVYLPPLPRPLPPLDGPRVDSTDVLIDLPTTGTTANTDTGGGAAAETTLPRETPSPTPSATLPATPAVPRGRPGEWVTTEDYRSRWIAEELTGTARFRLTIGASGRVTGCEITRSTGHAALDRATCELVTRRARFTPARNGNGEAVAGSYENAVVWQLPE